MQASSFRGRTRRDARIFFCALLVPFGVCGEMDSQVLLQGLLSVPHQISAGNFDGKLGPHLFNLHEILG